MTTETQDPLGESLASTDEASFQDWYKGQSGRLGLSPNPDDPLHYYDWRSAYRAGAQPNAEGHWPSQFKLPGHPNLIVNGIDTRTGRPASTPGYLAGNSMLQAPSPVPTFKDMAAQIVGGDNGIDIARNAMQSAQAMAPTAEQYQEAQNRRADAASNYLKTDADGRALVAARQQEVDLAAQQYEALAKQMLPQVQQAQPAPGRGLQPFLSSTKDEDPYTTIGKFVQSMSLLATMAGGGRNGARASLSALTGALEGWREGSRYKADAAYQTWKDETANMFKQFDDEMRRYNSIMVAERVPLDQKLRGLELAAWQHKNATAAAAFGVGEADKALNHYDQMRKIGLDAQMKFADIVARKENADQKYDLLQQQINLQNDKLAQQIAALASGEKLKWEIEQLRSATRLKELESKIDAKNNRAPLSVQDKKTIDDALDKEGMFARMDELLQSGKVDMNKILGGINPWLNSLSQRWGGRGNMPPQGTEPEQIDKKKMGRLTPEENEFLSVMHNYSSKLIHERYAGNVTGNEFDRYLQFGLDASMSPATNRSRMAALRLDNVQTLRNRLRRMEVTGTNAPDINDLIPRLGAPVALGAPAPAPAPGSVRQGNEWVSESGKYVWRNGAWVAR